MRRGIGRATPSNLPILKTSRGSPAASSSSLARVQSSHARSAEDLSQTSGGLVNSGGPHHRAMSPGSTHHKALSPVRTSQTGMSQTGVRYITEDLIRKITKEDNLEMVTSLNLTLAKEGGKKLKYIENLDRLRKLQNLNLSNNMIEKMEKMDKLLRLTELNISHNCITRIEGIENLTGLQVLNMSSNFIEHIPTWLPKKLQALRIFRIADNKLASLSEVAKLKAIPDLIHLEVRGNPLSSLPHARLYIIFHLRCVENLDSSHITDTEREKAHSRFALGEVQNLEQQLEMGESRYRQLEESHNRSEQERSLQELSQTELQQRERNAQETIKRLQQELAAKDDLLKHKTMDLNKACEKHYQLEQELAFFKIDSKFQSLGAPPPPQQDLSSDDGGLLGESPYIGRARYKANTMADEGLLMAAPQRVQVHSLRAPESASQSKLLPSRPNTELEGQLAAKKKEMNEAEEKLNALQAELSSTEQKLFHAMQELKKLAPSRNTPVPFQTDSKFKIRQRLAKKMQSVNELRDHATQMEDEIDRVQQSITHGHSELSSLKNELQRMDTKSSAYQAKQKAMVDKEQQINERHNTYGQLQHKLGQIIQNITKETAEIQNLEDQLSVDQVDNVELDEPVKLNLDEIVSGLSSYVEDVKEKSIQHQQELESAVQEREALKEKIRRLEAELSILDTEAQNAKVLQKQLEEAEARLNKTQEKSQNLQDDLHRSRQKDLDIQNRLEQAEAEVKRLNQNLNEAEKKAQSEKKTIERQLQMERERLEKMTHRLQDANRHDLEAKKIMAQLEAAKSLNASLRDQLEDLQHQQQQQDESFSPSELKKRLRKFTHEFKTNKSPSDPANKDDFLGTTLKEIYQTAQDKLNKSMREAEEAKKSKAMVEAEIQTVKEKLKKAETQLSKQDNKKDDEEKKRLQEEIQKLKAALKQMKEGGIPVRIVYAPSDGSVDRTSSLNSDEKLLFDELQRELMELKQHMRQQEHDTSRKLIEAESEAAHWQEEMREQQRQFEEEIERHKQESDLMREKQEARIQVIAQDLDQAQYVADVLKQALNDREGLLHQEMGAADMSNHMLSAQEEELSRLYNILEAQRSEIENLNQMLDYLAAQGPDGVGPSFDDELWRVRQEVNKLKETLAMQSAYVQSMPSTQSYGMQAGLPPPFLQNLGAGSGTGVGVGSGIDFGNRPQTGANPVGNGYQHRFEHRPHSVFATGMPLYSSAPNILSLFSNPSPGNPAGDNPSSGVPSAQASASQLQRQAMGPGVFTTPLPQSNQIHGMTADPRSSYVGPLGNERRESKVPPGGRGAVGRVGETTSNQKQSRPADRVSGVDQKLQRHVDHNQHTVSVPSAFEPFHRQQTHGTPAASHFPPIVPPAPPANTGTGNQLLQASLIPPYVARRNDLAPNAGVNTGDGFNKMPSAPLQAFGPSQSVQTSGFQGPSRSVQTGSVQTSGMQIPFQSVQAGVAAPASVGYTVPQPVPGGISSAAQQPSFIPMPVPVYVERPSPGQLPQPLQSAFSADTMTHGYVPSQHVAFDPVATQYSYNNGSAGGGVGMQEPVYSHSAQMGSQPPGVYNVGLHAYFPSGPAQRVTYQPARAFVPAGSDGGQSARIYYSARAPIPMPAPGAPPPPPAQPVTILGASFPGHVSVPVTPIATGTPNHSGYSVPVNFDGTYGNAPPSPIRALNMESPPGRGILKNGSGDVGLADESYLFCNVPDHHDLEDYIAELQEKLKRLNARLAKEKNAKDTLVKDQDKKVIKRLLSELEDRRDELEGLDLAIERQKQNLKKMKREERELKSERTDARSELEKLREKNVKKLLKFNRRSDDNSFDEVMVLQRQKFLQEEVSCLERTLAKRQTQLREAERALKDTNADLRDAKEQTRETVKRYDDATVSLQSAITEQQEIDRRANDVATQLVKSLEHLVQVKADLKALERKRSRQERLLKDINQVISKKDTEFRDIDGRVKAAQISLSKVQEDLSICSEREKESVDALRDSEEILGKRRAEIARMREQVEGQRAELERLDVQIGRKRTELQLLQESQDRRQVELNNLLRQAEDEVTSKQREIKAEQTELEQLGLQKSDLASVIKAKRNELHKLQEEVQQEEEVLQRLTSSVNKNKSELKHTYEMQTLEQNELENLRAQHSQKMVDLEKIQRELLEEKSELEQLNAETSRKSAELDRVRQTLERERGEVDALRMEKQSLEDGIATLTREQSILGDSCKSLDDKINTLKRSQRNTEEKLEKSTRRLALLEEELGVREREMEEANLQRTILQKDVQMLKQNVKDMHAELEHLQQSVSDAESSLRNIEHDISSSQQRREDARVEVQRLAEAIRQSTSTYEEAARQERAKHEELQDLIRSIEDREREHQDARKALNRLRNEIEKEENKMNKLVSNASSNLDQIRADLIAKQEELDKTTQALNDLKKAATHVQENEEQFAEIQKRVSELEHDVEERNKEKNELANALSISYEEVQRLRKESADTQEKMRKDQLAYESTLRDIQQQLEHTRQELQQVQQRSTAQVSELQSIAEQEFKKANVLRDQLDKFNRDFDQTQRQTDQWSDDKENQRVSQKAIALLAQDGMTDGWTTKQGTLRERLAHEQDYLKFQLEQQMSRHNNMMESARKKSEETINHLKRKLNSLQEVLFNSYTPDIETLQELSRSRSQSPIRYGRRRSPSPLTRNSSRAYVADRSRSRSFERIGSPMIPERDYL